MKFKNTLNEASFSDKNLSKVATLYGKLLSKQFNCDFFVLDEEKFKSGSRSGRGVRLMSYNGDQLRFNFTKNVKGLSQDTFYVSSIDYWKPEDFSKFNHPSYTCEFSKEANVIQIWDEVINALKNGKIGKIKLGGITEAKIPAKDIPDNKVFTGTMRDRINFSKKMKWSSPIANARNPEFKDWVSGNHPKYDYTKDWLNFLAEVYPGGIEENDLETIFEEEDEKLEKETPVCNPEYIFEDIERGVKIVHDAYKAHKPGRTRCLLVMGLGGLGKTFHVDKVLKELYHVTDMEADPDNIVYSKGLKASALSFYRIAFKARNKILYIDEADQLFKDDEIIKMLKGLWDTSEFVPGKTMCTYETRTVPLEGIDNIERFGEIADNLMKTKKLGLGQIDPKEAVAWDLTTMDDDTLDGLGMVPLPNKFLSSGMAICITNMKKEQIEQAVRSRCWLCDVMLSGTDVFRRMQSIDVATGRSKSNLEAAKKIKVLAEAVGLTVEWDENGVIKPDETITQMYNDKKLELNMRDLSLLNMIKDSIGDDYVTLRRLLSYQTSSR